MTALRLLVGILSFVPVVTFLYGVFITPTFAEYNPNVAIPLDVALTYVFRASFAVVFIGFLSHALFAQTGPRGLRKGLWGALMIFGSIAAFPFYWFLYIRPAPTKARIG